jgi:hypothetical protein
MAHTCPFCGKGDYPYSWQTLGSFPETLRDYGSSVIKNRQLINQNADLERELGILNDAVRSFSGRLKQSRRRARAKALKDVCSFLQHYKLQEIKT